jgi:hypothetical protein
MRPQERRFTAPREQAQNVTSGLKAKYEPHYAVNEHDCTFQTHTRVQPLQQVGK